MASTATIALNESKIRPGQPFRVRLGLVLSSTDRVRAVVPSVSVDGRQDVSCAIEPTGPNSRDWGVVIYAVPKEAQSISIGARLDISTFNELTSLWDSTSIEATPATMVVNAEDGVLLFNTFEQSGLKAATL